MGVDQKTLGALEKALVDLRRTRPHPIPTGVISALSSLAKPGAQITVDVAASEYLGAPLVLISDVADDTKLLAPLTNRQKQVAKLILEGLSNSEIASKLHISVATVKDHVHAILVTLQLPSRSAVIAASRARIGS